mmetsp:Transcript_49045/g.142816  ORF Transcript_49045/g.142816 Transcript_49045/m.142816 type:complete len:223 (-) Transcript_49045:347-1015(-)
MAPKVPLANVSMQVFRARSWSRSSARRGTVAGSTPGSVVMEVVHARSEEASANKPAGGESSPPEWNGVTPRSASCFSTQRRSSPNTRSIAARTEGSWNSDLLRIATKSPATLNAAISSTSPAGNDLRMASNMPQNWYTNALNCKSTGYSPIRVQTPSRFDGITSPPSSTSPSASFLAANALKASDFVRMSRRSARTVWRERLLCVAAARTSTLPRNSSKDSM